MDFVWLTLSLVKTDGKICLINWENEVPGNFLGFLKGTNFAPIAKAIGGPKIKPLASIPVKMEKTFHHNDTREL